MQTILYDHLRIHIHHTFGDNQSTRLRICSAVLCNCTCTIVDLGIEHHSSKQPILIDLPSSGLPRRKVLLSWFFFPRGGYCYSCSVFFCRCKMSQYSNQYTYAILILASTFQNDPKASWEFTSWNSVCNPTKALDLHLLGFEGLTSSTLPTAFVFSIKLFQEMDIQHGNAKKNSPFLEANVNISPFTDRGPMLGTPPRVWNTGVLRGIPGGDHQ